MKKILPIILLFVCASGWAQLTDQSRVSLVTCAPGDIVYEKFGHTALRICDSTLNLDMIFHYGVFDFEQDFFIPKFVQGATDYEIGLCSTPFFLRNYAERGSAVTEQVLNLTLPQRQTLFDALIENYKPENRLYRYNFVFDNCATRPYHMVLGAINRPALCAYSTDDLTYRDIIHGCIGWNNWTAFGIALVLGSQADRQTGNEGAIGFPFYLRDEFAETWIQTSPDTIVPLVAEQRTLVDRPARPIENTPTLLAPTAVFIFLLILGIALTIFDWRRKKISRWVDCLIFSVVGLVGCIIFYLMCFSQHPLVGANWNLFWANPLLLFFALMVMFKRGQDIRWRMALFLTNMLIIALVVQFTASQTFHTANIFVILLMIVRLIPYLFKKSNSKIQIEKKSAGI